MISPADLRSRTTFDIIGDVHGCFDELCDLLLALGYRIEGDVVTPPFGRIAVFLGDLIDRGPKIVESATLVKRMVDAEGAACVMGNHEHQMLCYMRGETKRAEWGLPETLEQLAAVDPCITDDLRSFAASLPVSLDLDDGKLLIAHAGLPEALQNDLPENAAARRWFALNGCHPEQGHRRADWAKEYRGAAMVVYGHTPIDEPRWIQRTLCIDTGCVYGGALTALRYPELEVVSVPARTVHYR